MVGVVGAVAAEVGCTDCRCACGLGCGVGTCGTCRCACGLGCGVGTWGTYCCILLRCLRFNLVGVVLCLLALQLTLYRYGLTFVTLGTIPVHTPQVEVAMPKSFVATAR